MSKELGKLAVCNDGTIFRVTGTSTGGGRVIFVGVDVFTGERRQSVQPKFLSEAVGRQIKELIVWKQSRAL